MDYIMMLASLISFVGCSLVLVDTIKGKPLPKYIGVLCMTLVTLWVLTWALSSLSNLIN